MDRLETVIWDFNGTILNDTDLATQSINVLLRRRNLAEITAEHHRHLFRFPVSQYYQDLGLDLAKEEHSLLSDEFHEEYLAGVGSCRLSDGVSELLRFLQERGIRQFVLSAAEQSMLESWVKGLDIGKFLDGLYGLPDRLAESKESRGRDLLHRFNVEPQGTLLIGDTDHDASVANALGCRCAIVTQGHQTRSRVQASDQSCDVYDSFHQLASWVRSNTANGSRSKR